MSNGKTIREAVYHVYICGRRGSAWPEYRIDDPGYSIRAEIAYTLGCTQHHNNAQEVYKRSVLIDLVDKLLDQEVEL